MMEVEIYFASGMFATKWFQRAYEIDYLIKIITFWSLIWLKLEFSDNFNGWNNLQILTPNVS